MKIQVIKVNGALFPAYDSDYEAFKRMPEDKKFEIDFTKGRNYEFHKKFMALCNLAFDNQDIFTVFNRCRYFIIKEAGYYYEEVNPVTGEVTRIAESISFTNMDELQFQKLYEDAKEFIKMWLSIENEHIAEEVERFF